MIRNGDVELKAREEEIRFLKMEVTQSLLFDLDKRTPSRKKKLVIWRTLPCKLARPTAPRLTQLVRALD